MIHPIYKVRIYSSVNISMSILIKTGDGYLSQGYKNFLETFFQK